MIVDLWVTMRGFSYASAWNEKYKQAKQKTTRKSKGVRKDTAMYRNITTDFILILSPTLVCIQIFFKFLVATV